MSTHMNDQLFELLFESAMQWGESWRAHDGRFENHSSDRHDAAPSYEWKMAYWIGENTANMVLARSWILDQGYECELLLDLAEHPNGDQFGWLLLTDYLTPTWSRIKGET